MKLKIKPEVGDIWEYDSGSWKEHYVILEFKRSTKESREYTSIFLEDGTIETTTFYSGQEPNWSKVA